MKLSQNVCKQLRSKTTRGLEKQDAVQRLDAFVPVRMKLAIKEQPNRKIAQEELYGFHSRDEALSGSPIAGEQGIISWRVAAA
ncbi:hypothetical protein KIN20_028294 [Parelaphostrongylus tenuis]|uniref:Uncharacterized protein n=1 Tax=Parelaphostrongylus tenuis TaxID=148309 RepID=A0AAD5R0Y4_PARTN|nr:hypothetical protein KIN20_028294 [Parelaphostrongylus tenuis]